VRQTLLDKPVGSLIKLDWEKALYLILIVLALATRLWGLGDRVQSHDECIHTKYSWNLYAGYGFQHNPLMHGPFLFHATALSYFLFGDNDFSARVPVALIGVAVVAFPYLLRRWLGRAGALVTSFLLLISPSIAYYSRYIRHDIPIILWALIVFWAILSYLRDRRERWLYAMAAGVSLMFATKEVAFIYGAIFGLFLVGLFAAEALRREWAQESWKAAVLILLAVTVAGLCLLGVGLLRRVEEQPGLEWWSIAGGGVAGLALVAAAALVLAGTWQELREFRSFDLIVVLGTLCLPFLSPILIQAVGQDPLNYNAPTIYYSGGITGAVLVVSAVVGLVWNWRRWSIAAAIHYAIFVVFFTTVFTNGTGIASGLVGSLGYWLAQQAVERGGQPWYYYLVMVPLYEYLPFLLTLIAPFYLLLRPKRSTLHPPSSPPSSSLSPLSSPLSPLSSPFLPFLLWWVGMAWVGYSYAGERMPWLTVHLALPMILLSGWLVGRLIAGTDWEQVWGRRAWLLGLVAPPLVMAAVMLTDAALAGPFAGHTLEQLDATGRFLGGLGGVLAFGAGLVYLAWRSGWRVAVRVLLLVALMVPVLLTVRTAWRFCYTTYDYPTEFLVYAHSAPAVKETMRQIENLSRRTIGDPNQIQIAYGSDGSTLWYWYLRDYPNATFYGETPSREAMQAPIVIAGRDQWEAVAPYMTNDAVVNTYTYLWWPMEDYRNLNWDRIRRTITDPQTRAAVWDIWYSRDYRRYDQLTGKKHTLDEWPLRAEYRLYIRRDVAAQIWDQTTAGPEAMEMTDPYAEGWRDLAARQVIGSQGAEPGQFDNPRGIKVGPDGFIYVADSGNHRIQKFTADGDFVAAWGSHSVAEAETSGARGFNEPWDVAVGAGDGSSAVSIYVADTWNHRIQKLDDEGNLVTVWGLFGQYGVGDTDMRSAFYGPRGIAAGPDGRVYVADTGNKRIQVFEPDGRFAYQWGRGGALEGYLDEPVGIAVAPEEGLPAAAGGKPESEGSSLEDGPPLAGIYVADTWNRRVQVFDEDGTYLRQWAILGWDAGLPEEKPYLAVDGAGYVYVTDPGHYRVLVFDYLGNYVLSFGQYGFDERSFTLPMGIAVAEDGTIYVTDAHSGRVMVFDSPINE